MILVVTDMCWYTCIIHNKPAHAKLTQNATIHINIIPTWSSWRYNDVYNIMLVLPHTTCARAHHNVVRLQYQICNMQHLCSISNLQDCRIRALWLKCCCSMCVLCRGASTSEPVRARQENILRLSTCSCHSSCHDSSNTSSSCLQVECSCTYNVKVVVVVRVTILVVVSRCHYQ
jgi:hypothetical protein